MIRKKILIATGGTGGHVFPAYALANYLKGKNYDLQLTTDSRGYFYLKEHKSLNLVKLPSSPLEKKNLFKLLFSFLVIMFSIIRSLLFLLNNRPSIIFGMGGYSSFPICIAASILRIKFIIYENNLIIGKANKYLLPFAKKILVSHEELEGIPEKYKSKVIQIGNIVREEIIKTGQSISTNKLDILKILILGGSQAAKVFAEKLPQILKQLKNSKIPIKVYQQCQKGQNGKLIEFYQNYKVDCEVFNFTDKIIKYYSKSNLVITRSGASVLGELINFKIPFISIPLPTSADNHQYKNAEFYLKKGCGFIVEEKDIDDKLYNLIKRIYYEKSLVNNILSNQRQYSDKNIFINLKTYIEKIINEKN